jgi:hypothetical protein
MTPNPLHLPYLFAIALGWLTFASADFISLGENGQLQGIIEPSTVEGMIQLKSPLAAEPLLIKKDTVTSLKFSSKKSTVKLPHRIRLKNGDQMPIEIASFSNQQLNFASPWSPSHTLEKSLIDSITLGPSEDNILYSGPKIKEWSLTEGCILLKDAIRFAGAGNASWQVSKLPSRHIISWTLSEKPDANFKIIIASDEKNPYAAENSGYSLTANQETLQLTRNSKAGKTKTYLLNDQKFLSQEKSNQSLLFQLYVDQDQRTLQLLINGKIIRNVIIDPAQTGEIPTGINYHVVCNGGRKNTYLRNFSISEWNHNGLASVSEKRVSTKTDMLYDVESNHCSGDLVSISKGAKKKITFSNPHTPAPIELPLESAAIFYFSGDTTTPNESILIRMFGAGTLHVKDYQLKDGMVHAIHSIMGELSIPVSFVEEITRS